MPKLQQGDLVRKDDGREGIITCTLPDYGDGYRYEILWDHSSEMEPRGNSIDKRFWGVEKEDDLVLVKR